MNLSNNNILGNKIRVADTFFMRLRGLMFKAWLEEGEGLLLEPCSMIHTFFMRIHLDVAYISKDNKVLYTMRNIRPNSPGPYVKGAVKVLELPAGTLYTTGTCTGDTLRFISEGKEYNLYFNL